MDDLISRQAAINALIRKMRPHDNGDGTMTIYAMSEGLVTETLNDLPAAEPDAAECWGCNCPRMGRWLDYCGDIKCNQCGCEADLFGIRGEWNYCPNCGARMTEESDGT